MGYSPGNFFPHSNLASDTFISCNHYLADERGMTFMNPDSFTGTGIGFMSIKANSQGFHAPYDYTPSVVDSLRKRGKRIVFIIGDSFTAGTTSTTYEKTFVQILRENNHDLAILAFGIRGVDPVNYRLVAEKFIRELHPDQVIVAFCGDNDIMSFDRTPIPFVPLMTFSCTSGNIMTWVQPELWGGYGMSLTEDSAYNFYRKKYSLFGRNNLLARICKQSCITTLLYPFRPDEISSSDIINRDSLATYRNLYRIKQLSDSVGSRFQIAFIPTPETCMYDSIENAEHFGWVFRELLEVTHFCKGKIITPSDYLPNDCHFNDSGNRKFAEMMQQLLITSR